MMPHCTTHSRLRSINDARRYRCGNGFIAIQAKRLARGGGLHYNGRVRFSRPAGARKGDAMKPEYADDTLERETADVEVATSFATEGPDDDRDEKIYLRPAGEDDDDYDPYQDRRNEPPLFERDPWD